LALDSFAQSFRANAGMAEVGLRAQLSRRASIDLNYNGQFAVHANDQSARLTFAVSF
jgi:outer membrane autotransporter protein